jgi:putative membrane protein|tara:strand:+ start:319 stop:837 length:519 start_codon:yes stop_codon:yes gene_type:complete
MQPSKSIVWGIYIFSAIVYALVIILHELPGAELAPPFTSFQPLLHASLNGTCFILLIASLTFIKKGNVQMHKRLNSLAMLLSVMFLLSYVVYHYFAGDTEYLGDFKRIYIFILVTHIFLAGLSLPFILLAYYHGFIGNLVKHKKMVRFVYPIWLYVTCTGVIVYLFLAPYYA